MDLSIDQLQTFLTVVEVGTFTLAAEQLGRTQSAVSYAIATLERDLGVALFDRTKRPPILTEAGQDVLNEGLAIVRRIERLQRRATLHAGDGETRVSLGVDVLQPQRTLVAALQGYYDEFPDVVLEVRVGDAAQVAQWLDEGAVDIAVMRARKHLGRRFHRETIRTLDFIPVIGSGHELAELADGLSRDELTTAAQVVLGEGVPTCGFPVWHVYEPEVAIDMVLNGLAWAFLPLSAIDDHLIHLDLLPLTVEEWTETVKLPLWGIYPKRQPPGPAGQWLLEQLGSA